MSQQVIAERVGASRSMINRILKDLTAGGYIDMQRGKIRIRRDLPKHW
jgi:CRP/FNR family transcriptional regulator, cyclic AMP receptor protein